MRAAQGSVRPEESWGKGVHLGGARIAELEALVGEPAVGRLQAGRCEPGEGRSASCQAGEGESFRRGGHERRRS